MDYQILIGGVDLTSNLIEGSLTVNKNLNTKNSMSCSILKREEDNFSISPGQEITVVNDGEIIYGGLIQKAPHKRISKGNSKTLKIEISTMAYEQITGRRTVAGTWENTYAGVIVQSLTQTWLSTEGITVGEIDSGVLIEKYSVKAKSIKGIIDDLAEASGFQWWISMDKKLYFKVINSAEECPYNIGPGYSFTDYDDVSLDNDLSRYANKVFVLGKEINGQRVMGAAEDQVEIEKMASLYGSGVYGITVINNNITSNSEAQIVAQNILKAKLFNSKLSFKTNTSGFKPGQIIKVQLSEFEELKTEKTFIIESVRAVDVRTKLKFFISARSFTSETTYGEQKDWTDAFKNFVNKDDENKGDNYIDLNFNAEFLRAPYGPAIEFEFEEVSAGSSGYAFPPSVSVGLQYDPLIPHDGSLPYNYSITPFVSLVSHEVSGILYYRGFKVHWIGDNVPESIPNTYVSAIAMIRK
ncbi:hypothetical protein [Paramaledivibacter caminithermalis]|uniref:Uncharacterized protein n=1 Tax=Paramaledivibacter caminithermalis (strain DSM 15212 / CIP 107654 / DViRD3) TaxID=1121301 RepID=A0A1M6SWE5_PARC5|nr:hypothetical protein [Paramaledivibacter caminithermalis]SHK49072.1 hypothetical protein SAMN02745912_03464 [Paramaledivibacter caminithermalis DSM 15212]